MTEIIRVLKTGFCPSLSSKSTLTYQIGFDNKEIFIRLHENSGVGLFNKEWVDLEKLAISENKPFTSNFLQSIFKNRSYDTGGFLADILLNEGLIKPVEGKLRSYQCCDPTAFLVLLKYMLNLAIKWEVPGVKVNPAAGVKFYEANARERFLTAEETQRLLAELDKNRNTQLKYIVPLLLLLGCRKRNLLDSRWEDIDLDRRTWRIPMSKSGKARQVPLSKAAIEMLNQLPRWEDCPYVVPNPDTKLPFVMIQRAWDNVRKAAGLPDVRMHDLRHSMASNMVNSGRSIYEVATVLGHSQLKTSQRYGHLSQETLLAAVDAAATATGMRQV